MHLSAIIISIYMYFCVFLLVNLISKTMYADALLLFLLTPHLTPLINNIYLSQRLPYLYLYQTASFKPSCVIIPSSNL